MLAVVISIANHTLEKSPSPKDFISALSGRLHAMARAYGLLSRTNWKEAPLAELVQHEVEAFGSDRFKISGPQVSLIPQQGLSVGLVIHELATNASKYGALSKANGIVDIAWKVADDELQLVWAEKDGPAVKQPDQEGFGLALVKGEIAYRLRGEVETFF
ncbi:sensor histidine kinase, partial [Escherichia coli]|uniref:sensor histidine kinase n=1 Tax=Escherichia coli TaxID=562 RepID=UPI0012C226FA